MSASCFPIGLEMDVSYPDFKVRLALQSATQFRFKIKEGPFAWDVLQNEVPVTVALGGISMFDLEEGTQASQARRHD